jgi:protein-L-isoaspartate(D-aspartate) O-methyltransferase
MTDRLTDFRTVFAQMVVARGGCKDPRIRAAFERVPRHEFLGPGPWYVSEQGGATPSADPALAYQDVAMALAPERGITTGLPSLHARCIEACAPQPGERVVHIGAGAGYFTAILAELVGEGGSVLAYEIDPPLAERATAMLAGRRQVRVESRSGVTAIEGPVDLIYVCAGLQQIPVPWLAALAPGGRLAVPLTPGTDEGGMLLVTHVGNPRAFAARFLCPARFIPCLGATDAEAGQRLAAAFHASAREDVRSLRLTTRSDGPDETVWFAGDGWWLSTGPA